MIRTLILVVCLGAVCSLHAQTFSEALAKANLQMGQMDAIAYEVEYISYSNAQIMTRQAMQIERVDGITYSILDGVEAYQFDSTQVLLDHQEKLILLNEGVATNQANTGFDEQFEMLTQIQALAKSENRSVTNGTVTYTLQFDEGTLKSLLVELDEDSGLFQRLLLEPAEPVANAIETEETPVTAFEVRVTNYDSSLTALSQPLSDYLQAQNDQYFLQPEFSNYQYTNNYGQ